MKRVNEEIEDGLEDYVQETKRNLSGNAEDEKKEHEIEKVNN